MVQTLSRRVTRKEFFTLPLISNGNDHDINKIKNSCKNNFKRMSTSSYVSELLTWIDILFLSPPLISFHLIFVSFDYPFSFLTKQILVLLSSCQPITQCQPANKPMSWNSFSQGTIWSTSSMEFHFLYVWVAPMLKKYGWIFLKEMKSKQACPVSPI